VDGFSSQEEICREAQKLGLSEIGFAEHLDFEPEDVGYGFFNYEAYTKSIQDLRRKFAGSLIIRKGLEVDYQDFFDSEVRQTLRKWHFDYLIGSVHYIDHIMISEESLAGKSARLVYPRYFHQIEACIDSGLFNILGHLDYVRRLAPDFANSFSGDLMPMIKEVLSRLIRRKMALEISTKAGQLALPTPEVLALYKEMGGRLISIGSDCHHRSHLAGSLRQARSLAASAGFTEVATFEDGRMKLAPL
jgi:histidinol-phosphatase (PHP family)